MVGLADVLSRQGEYGEAVAALERGLEALPDGEAAAPDSTVRDGTRALELALSLYQRRPVVARGETVAMALAELGRCDEAAARQQELLAVAERANAVELAAELQEALALYTAGPPCRPPVAGTR